jgi:hypothetical protein
MKFHSDLILCQLVRVHVNNSLKIFFSETSIPRKLIFGRNVPWVVLSKICSYGSGIPNIFQTGSEKQAKSLKIFPRTVSATGEHKNRYEIYKRSFLNFVGGNFLPIFVRLCFREFEGMKNHYFNVIPK